MFKFANAQTNEVADTRRKTMPPVSLAGVGIKNSTYCKCLLKTIIYLISPESNLLQFL